MKNKINNIKNNIINSIDITKSYDNKALMEEITKQVFNESKRQYLNIEEKREITKLIFNTMRGHDILQPYIDDPTVTEIMVNGYKNIFIERNGIINKVNSKFESEKKLENILQKIVSRVNRTVNESTPIVDARLEDGSRVNIVLPPVSLNGPILTIRKFSNRFMKMDDLIKSKTISRQAATELERLVKAKYNIFISGGTSSGKTTFLNILANYIPKNERIVTIEDSAELQINIDNIVKLETKNSNYQYKGEITTRDLIKTSLRMRPDRIIVGEVRGIEALDMLQAMNTGHDGSISTGHANSIKDMITRLETMVLLGANIPINAVRQQLASALDIMIHLTRYRENKRKVTEIAEVIGCEDNRIIFNKLFVYKDNELVSTGNKITNRTKIDVME